MTHNEALIDWLFKEVIRLNDDACRKVDKDDIMSDYCKYRVDPKNCIHKFRLDSGGIKWCSVCGSYNIDKDWMAPKRRPPIRQECPHQNIIIGDGTKVNISNEHVWCADCGSIRTPEEEWHKPRGRE